MALAVSERRLRAASDLIGLAVYSWNPVTDALDWDDALRSLWGLRPGEAVDRSVFESGIHPNDREQVRKAIAACVDPTGGGAYAAEYRVIGRDGIERWIATTGRTTFRHGRAVDFLGVAVDVTQRRRAEAEIRESEARFRSFATHSTSLLWLVDPAAELIEYLNPAYEQIWGQPRGPTPVPLSASLAHVHRDDVGRVRGAFKAVEGGDATEVEYRIIRPCDGEVRWLRDTSFPISRPDGRVIQIGGICQDLTRHDVDQIYIVGASSTEQRRLTSLVRKLGLRGRAFATADAFLDIAPFLAAGCVLVDLRLASRKAASVPTELKARSIPLKAVVIGPVNGDVAAAVEAMKAGAADYLEAAFTEDALRNALACARRDASAARDVEPCAEAAARIARLTPREREVLDGLIAGGGNKAIAGQLGISPRTVELHRGQIMAKMNAGNLAELLRLSMAAGLGSLSR